LRLQAGELGGGGLKNKIFRKALGVAAHLLIESPRLDAVKRGKIGVEHDLLAADDEDLPGDLRGDDECSRFVLFVDAAVFHEENNGFGGW